MNDTELLCRSERRFGRLEAYEKILHYTSVLAPWVGFFGGTRVSALASLGFCALLRAGWAFVIDEETRQHHLVMARQDERLERLLRP